jgi:hypothetical protein
LKDLRESEPLTSRENGVEKEKGDMTTTTSTTALREDNKKKDKKKFASILPFFLNSLN